MQSAAEFRHHMIDGQLEPNRVLSGTICAAMGIVPREWFVPEEMAGCAYADEHVALGDNRFMLSPLLFGQLLQALDVRAGQKVLLVGSAMGYGAAVLHHLGCKVYMLEESQDLANKARQILTKQGMGKIEVHAGALRLGYESAAPYDRILAEGGATKCPDAWRSQLSKDGGKLAYVDISSQLPMSQIGRGFVTVIERLADEWLQSSYDDVSAPIFPGMENKEGFKFD